MISDKFDFVQVINACAGLGALEDSRLVQEQLIQSGCGSNAFVGNSLVDMYAKCGNIEGASRVFNKMPSSSVVTWTNHDIRTCETWVRAEGNFNTKVHGQALLLLWGC
ncbi:hypothetical protein BDL97_03G094000 [Sphagnum fallax]|nr:hypothetical protein BDL97_03G094000 [Sphagnum fallax]